MERFAKLFETTRTQVLVYVDSDDEANETMLRTMGCIEGIRFEVNGRWGGIDQHERAMEALEKFGEPEACHLVDRIAARMLGEEGA